MTDSPSDDVTGLFEAERPRLLGLAYRVLGTLDDADDVVQEAWVRWERADRGAVERPVAWLTTVTSRLALDRLRAVRRRREEYVGPWLPEPLVSDAGPEAAAEMADSLTLAFLTVLDQLGPVERAVFVLADVFAVPYAEIAETVGKSAVACRQIASRARRRVRQTPTSRSVGADRHVVDDLLVAIAGGDADAVVRRLAPDVVCTSDGGSARRAARRPVVGASRVARFLVNLAKRSGDEMAVRPVTVNGDAGVVISIEGVVDIVAAFEVREDVVVAIRIVRNPDKLRHLGEAVLLR